MEKLFDNCQTITFTAYDLKDNRECVNTEIGKNISCIC